MAFKFPDPTERSEKEPIAFCSTERVLALYNKFKDLEADKKAKSVSKTVRGWFLESAKEKGWTAVIFVKDVEKHKASGCVLYRNPLKVTKNMFVDDGEEIAVIAGRGSSRKRISGKL